MQTKTKTIQKQKSCNSINFSGHLVKLILFGSRYLWTTREKSITLAFKLHCLQAAISDLNRDSTITSSYQSIHSATNFKTIN